jgi:hypothetical protein
MIDCAAPSQFCLVKLNGLQFLPKQEIGEASLANSNNKTQSAYSFPRLQISGDSYRGYWLGSVYRTGMEFINAVFDKTESINMPAEIMLRQAKFSRSFETTYDVSSDPNVALDTLQRKIESFYARGRNRLCSRPMPWPSCHGSAERSHFRDCASHILDL